MAVSATVDAVVFDLGRVLLDWDPAYLYERLIEDPAERQLFLNEICTMAWHHRQDSGVPMAANIAELVARHPDKADWIRAWDERWPDMFRGSIEGSVKILSQLSARQTPLFALTNMPAEKYPWTEIAFPFMSLFQDVVVSGYEKVAKPDPRIFEILMERSGYEADRMVFIDDSRDNIASAERLGFQVHHFQTPERLSTFLSGLGLIESPES